MDANFVELAKLIGNYGVGIVCLAVLISLHVYNVRVAMPALIEASRKELANILATFKEEQTKERTSAESTIQALATTFRDGLDKERANSSAIIQTLASSFKEELKHERDQCHEDHEKMMSAIQVQQSQLIQICERQDILLMSKARREKGNKPV